MEHQHVHSLESRVRSNTETLLAILAKYNAQGTFFFLGSVAEQFPDLVRETKQLGHEIASHGYGHHLVYNQTREEFKADVQKSVDILQSITGERIVGYRAPSWSFSKKTPWVYAVLAQLGFAYSSSIFPFATYLYGDGTAPTHLYRIDVDGYILQEIPATVLDLQWVRIPYGGGFYFRFFPYWFTELALRLTQKQKRLGMLYLHPREIDPKQPRLDLPVVDRFVSYCNLDTTMAKLDKILSRYKTTSVVSYLEHMVDLKIPMHTNLEKV
jgi:polysaccharide deacetylase family protein (PEP-CTERM system associated)